MSTEFRFDVFQMARTKGGRDLFHHSIQFEVATRAPRGTLASLRISA